MDSIVLYSKIIANFYDGVKPCPFYPNIVIT